MKRQPVLAIVSGLALAAVGTAWLVRFRVADALVESRLAAAGVPAGYRITRVGPFHERIEDLRLGDPASPDLTAARVDIMIGYAPGPVVQSVRAEHVRIAGRIGAAGLSLGSLDRLLPRTDSAGAALPDLHLSLHDARLALDTPNGRLTAALDGSGNPQRRFSGRAVLDGAALRIASCRLARVHAALRVEAQAGAPSAAGDLAIAGTTCPSLTLGGGGARVALRADRVLRHIAGKARLAGFPGRAGTIRFASVSGPLRAEGELGALDVDGSLTFGAVVAPPAVRDVAAGLPTLLGTPLAPTMLRARVAVARLLARSDASVSGSLRIRGTDVAATVRRLDLVGDDGARLTAIGRGLAWSAAGLRLDSDVVTGGGGLPPLTLRLRQTAAGAPIAGSGSLEPYRAGEARVALPSFRFAQAGDRTTFEVQLLADGPIGASGAVRGLSVPLSGWADAGGRFAIGEGCVRARAALVTSGAFRFAEVALPLCGHPLIGNIRGTGVRVAASARPFVLKGATSGGAPIAIAARAAAVSDRRFALDDVEATIGRGDAPTRLSAATLAGSIDGGEPQGTFAGAAARIGTVPLAFADGDGRWRLDNGALRLAGALRVSETAATPRFRPLAADAATLVLENNVIRAAATLLEPASKAEVAAVDITHDLATGDGHVLLNVGGLHFTRAGLQPEAITPVTLGVIANVDGIVTGQGRIDWTGRGVTSRGVFATDRLDLAAAFGPVTGIKGEIRFTDLLGLVSAPDQVVTVAEVNPGVAIQDGVVRFALPGQNRVAIADARWPFAHGTLRLEPATIDLGSDMERRLTFRLEAIDAGAFVQQLDLPNVSATGTFDGELPMIFGQKGGRIAGGAIAARPPGGTIAYVGELSNARLGMMSKLAFDALKAIRYSTLAINLDGPLDGEMVSRVAFTGVREATPDQTIVTRLLRNLPFRFNITIRAPFRGLLGTARSYIDPSLLLQQQAAAIVQPEASGGVR